MFEINDEVTILDAMATDWIGKAAKITKVINLKNSPLCYELNIGGGHWLHSMLKKV